MADRPVREIDITNNDWNGARLALYHALLVGGSQFDNMKPQFLLRKPTEGAIGSFIRPSMPNSGSPGSQPLLAPSNMPVGNFVQAAGGIDAYQYRLRKTSYKPMIASLFGYLSARIFPANPEMTSLEDLLEDCDGENTNLISMARELLIKALTYSVGGGPTGAYIQLMEDEGDVKLGLADARIVTDWEDGDSCLDWVKTRVISPIRSEMYGKQDQAQWTWQLYTEEAITTYIATQKSLNSQRPAKIESETTVPHELGCCPLIRVKLREHQYLMDQLFGAIVEQFNLESDIASLCGKISNAQLILKTQQKDIGTIIIPQLGVIIMDPGDDGKFASPDPLCCDPLFKARDALRDALYNSINSSVMRSSADLVQNPRQSGVAKGMDQAPWTSWSKTFADPIKAAFTTAFRAMAAFKGVPEPEVTWPEPLDIMPGQVKSVMGVDDVSKVDEESPPEVDDGQEE